MKRVSIVLLSILLLVNFAYRPAGASAPAGPVMVSVTGSGCPQADFGVAEITAALADRQLQTAEADGDWQIVFAPVREELGAQAYAISVENRTITIAGGDERGLMYGGLEVAEQIRLYGLEGVTPQEAAPYVLNRGYMFNAPLDMRTPAYNSPGDSGQQNIENMWDIDFWHELLDDMARNRFNLLLFENINPYPSMVKVEGYEEIALADVWRTTIPYDNTAKGDCTNLVQEKNWENYEVLKTMTIDEKIDFWREVMAYAKSRGIDFHIKHSNIYTFVENGQYGITGDPDDPNTRDYFYQSAKALLNTYPDLKGLFLTPGENMGWSNEANAKAMNIQWLREVFGTAVNEMLAEQPDREFWFSVNIGAQPAFSGILDDLSANVLYTAQYAGTHMYATSTPHTADATFEHSVGDARYWIAFRNEDCFDLRWGDPEFMRDFVKGMPGQDRIFGFVTGSDGYCYGRDYSSTDPALKGQLYTEKHWLNFFLIGRMAFEPDLPDERIRDVFCCHYENMTGTEELFAATGTAGKIIPLVNRVYYQTSGDYTWYVAGCWSHPSTFGFIDLKRWMKGDFTYPDSRTMSIEEYALLTVGGESMPEDGRMLPTEVAEQLDASAEQVLATCNAIREECLAGNEPTMAEKNFLALVTDNEAMAYLGLFYAERIRGAIDIRIFNETKDERYRASAIAHLQQSASYFDSYAEIVSANYEPQQLARVGSYNVLAIAEEVRGDITIAEKWKPRKINPSYRTPDKEDYMRGD